MKKVMFIALVGLLIGFQSCKKVDSTNPDFIGLWTGATTSKDYVIDIESNSEGRYQESNGLLNSDEWEGKARYKNGKLKIGMKKLEVDQLPNGSEAGSTMVVEGVTYVRFE